jgi:hypothetical protein
MDGSALKWHADVTAYKRSALGDHLGAAFSKNEVIW